MVYEIIDYVLILNFIYMASIYTFVYCFNISDVLKKKTKLLASSTTVIATRIYHVIHTLWITKKISFVSRTRIFQMFFDRKRDEYHRIIEFFAYKVSFLILFNFSFILLYAIILVRYYSVKYFIFIRICHCDTCTKNLF